jgi:lysophospholipase L1-like esterase
MILPRTGAQMGDGRFEFVGTHATGGAQASTIKTTHIDGTDSPLNDNPKPSFAVVLAGSNDIGAVAPSNVVNPTQLASTLDAIESIWDTLIANDILPIACMLPPNNGTAQNAILAINQGIRERGHAKGLVVVDLFTPCWSGTGATWGTNMHTGDGTHPSVLGAKLMGQALRDAIDPLLLPTHPNIVDADTDAASDLMLHNGAFERDTNSDNIPNGGRTSGSETATFWILTANGATPTLAARTNFSGKALRLNKTDDTAGNTLLSSSGGSDAISLVDGHLYKVLLKGEIASWSGTNTQILYQAIKVTGDVPFRITFQNDFSFSGAIAPFIVGRTFLISNTGNFTSGSYRGGQVSIGFSTAGATTDNLGDVYFGQITYRDLGLA